MTINQTIVRRLRSTLSTAQQTYFDRVFIRNEDSWTVCSELLLPSDFESTMLRTLRALHGSR